MDRPHTARPRGSGQRSRQGNSQLRGGKGRRWFLMFAAVSVMYFVLHSLLPSKRPLYTSSRGNQDESFVQNMMRVRDGIGEVSNALIRKSGDPSIRTFPICKEWRDEYGVVAGVSWGSIPDKIRVHWEELKCDSVFGVKPGQVASPAASSSMFNTPGVDNWGVGVASRWDKREMAGEAPPWDVKSLSIKVLTYNRPGPLKRLLASLRSADYLNDQVAIEIWVDGPRGGKSTSERDECISIANQFSWPQGPVKVTVRDANVGLVGQWLGCCQLVPNASVATAIFEDDIEVSPLYWKWLKLMWRKYGSRGDLGGISLQFQHTRGSDGAPTFSVSNNNEPYLYKISGSWGFSPNPQNWPAFLEWVKKKKTEGWQPTTLQFRGKDVITTKWWKDMTAAGQDPRMWTQWFMTYMEDHGLLCLYPNLPSHYAFAASWNEAGEHDPGDMKGRRSTPLQMAWNEACERTPTHPVRLDFDGSPVQTPEKPMIRRLAPAGAPSLSSAVAASPKTHVKSTGKCDLSGTNFIFDGIIYHLQQGAMGGVAKMWYNIVPFMIDIVKRSGGHFTNCMVAHMQFKGADNVYCHDLSRIPRMPGQNKVFFSSYYRGTPDACFVHMVYDHIPERTGMYYGPGSEYYSRIENLNHAGGFLSLSKSTTDDLCELYKMCDGEYVSTSDNRMSPIFFPRDKDAVQAMLHAKGIAKPYFLVVGARYGYKNYGIFWDGIKLLSREVREKYMIVLVGDPEKNSYIETKNLKGVDEEHLAMLYTGAAAFVYPSSYEGFGMPPLEAAACGTNLILGPFHRDRMRQVFEDLARYATTADEMAAAMTRVAEGDIVDPTLLIERAKLWGTDLRHGWNEVAKDYLEYMIHGPFRSGVKGGRHCGGIVSDPGDCRFVTTETGIELAPKES